MGRGKEIITDHINGFQGEIQNNSLNDAATFFNWFDESGGDIDTTFIKGQCEFAFSILRPLLPFLKDTKSKVALEIGYGGGRLLAAATQVFDKVVGIDVHLTPGIIFDELKKEKYSKL